MLDKLISSSDEGSENNGNKTNHGPIDFKESLRIAVLGYLKEEAKYPKDFKVNGERIRHKVFKSAPVEPYYVSNGKEAHPKIFGEESGTVAYINDGIPEEEVNVLGAKKPKRTVYKDGLRFESRFESGNLAKAVKITPYYYELHLRPDLYINKHVQWFYFRITRMKKGITYRFTIINLGKGVSLYASGMRPLMYSVINSKKHSIGWRRCGSEIAYYTNEDDKCSLSFKLKFPNDNDTVYLAHCYPYTYSDLQDYLLKIMNDPVKAEIVVLRQLCKSVAGNNVYEVTITSEPYKKLKNKRKKAIVLTARVHPVETPSSWVMHGVLEFLTSNTEAAKELREQYVFKIIPMLNPDGVIVGNNRCSLSGLDLNRQYRSVIRESNPSIWNTKLMIKKLLQDHGVLFYCDFHAHSNRNNCFLFGCQNRKAVFPMMLQRNASDKFSLHSCEFNTDWHKEGTGRISMWALGISNSYTLEASIGGTDLRRDRMTHFNAWDYVKLGVTFCHTLMDFFDPNKEALRMKMLCSIARGEMLEYALSEEMNEENDSN